MSTKNPTSQEKFYSGGEMKPMMKKPAPKKSTSKKPSKKKC